MRALMITLTGAAAMALAAPTWSAPPQNAPHHVGHGQHHPGQDASPVPWRSLDPDARQMLAPLKPRWSHMPPHVQRHIMRKTRHWEHLPPARRKAIRRHIQHWQRMTPAERRRARANHRVYRHLTPQERARLHSAYERFKRMPPDEQKKLRAHWHHLSPSQKRQWIDNGAKGDLPHPNENGHRP